MSEMEMRTCRTCQQTMPLETAFRRRGVTYTNRHGEVRVYYAHSCKRCQYESQQARIHRQRPPKYHRMPRFNARGDAWCPHCKTYLPVLRFRAHPSRQGGLWAYCMECSRIKDRQRYNVAYADDERWKRELERRTGSKRKQRQRQQAERRDFVLKSLDTLRRKGLTWTDIAILTGVSTQSIHDWKVKPERRITAAAEARIAALLTAAIDLPVLTRVVKNRRAPEPVMDALRERMAPRIATLKPTRSKWRRQEAA